MPVHTTSERKKKGITRGKGGRIKKKGKKIRKGVLKGATIE